MNGELRFAVIDKDKTKGNKLRRKIEGAWYSSNFTIKGTYYQDLTSLVSSRIVVNVIFLNISTTPLQFFLSLKNFDTSSIKIICIANDDSQAIIGYQYDIFDYLIDPIDPSELNRVINRLKKALSNSSYDNKEESEIVVAKDEPLIAISENKRIILVKVKELCFCHGQGNYTFINQIKDQQIVSSKNLKYFETKLEKYGFVRIHKAYLVNINHAIYINKEEGGSLTITGEITLPLSKFYRKRLYQIIEDQL